MSRRFLLSRRTVLRGVGASLALPMLDAMAASSAAAAPAPAVPKRMAYFFAPNGVVPQEWFPKENTGKIQLTPILEPLKNVKDHVTFFSGLKHDKAKANGDGAGDHARSAATFLTGMQARKTAGADIQAGMSADQFAAHQIGEATRFGSLEIGVEPGRLAGNCDSGYSCAYSNTISWRSPTTPVAKEINPKLLFERLFGESGTREAAAAKARREKYNKSILDFVQDDAKALSGQLGLKDQRKMAEYLDAVREIEKRIEAAKGDDKRDVTIDYPTPAGIPKGYEEHVRLMGDLLILAFQTDNTRIATFMLANEGSNRSYNEIGVREGHHSLSHHGKSPTKMEEIAKINKYHIAQFAYVLEKMKTIKEGDKTMLDNVMLVYGCAIRDGDRHDHRDLPCLLAGGGGGTVKTGGKHIAVNEEPMCNLFLSLFDRMGVKADRFGDSTGRLKAMEG
jgi:hypothetical protein